MFIALDTLANQGEKSPGAEIIGKHAAHEWPQDCRRPARRFGLSELASQASQVGLQPAKAWACKAIHSPHAMARPP